MRKMLSLLLALLMTVTVVPVEAFAADLPTDFNISNDSGFEDLKDYLAAGENNYASGTEITVTGTRTIADESGVIAIPGIGKDLRLSAAEKEAVLKITVKEINKHV